LAECGAQFWNWFVFCYGDLMKRPTSHPDCQAEVLLDHLSTAVIAFDEQLNVCGLNTSAEILLSISSRKAVGRPLQRLVNLPQEDLSRFYEALSTGQPYTGREVLLRTPNGESQLIDYTATPYAGDAGARLLLVEMTGLDRHLRIAREEALLQQQEATRSLVRGLAHEIKNPLGGLRGAAQLLERELPDESLHEFTQIIIREADRLQNLIDRLLGPNARPQLSWVNVHEVIEYVRQLIGAEASPQVVLRGDYDPSIPLLRADRDWLVQAILNIAGNALNAIGERGSITFATRVLRHYTIGNTTHRLVARVEIIDDGPGIDAKMLEAMFFPMVTGRAEGTGLGLSIAQSLISQQGGLIECNSQPGRTVFSVLLPLEGNHES
jgi:two-component system nitrogen regulation sensor histidine kinase GlnL